MKISWGIKIIIGFSIFAAGIITMVAVSISKNIDLVNDNYYEQEIKYQQHIDLLKKSKMFEDNFKIYVQEENIAFEILDPKIFNTPEGEIYFYRSSDAKKDFRINFAPDEKGIQKMDKSNLDKGLWRVKITLYDNGKKYFTEKSLFLN